MHKQITFINRTLFLLFSVAYTCFFQVDLFRLIYMRLTEKPISVLLLFIFCLALACFSTFLAIPTKKLLKFSDELDAMNYLPSALFLGFTTSMNESYRFGYSWNTWILLLLTLLVLTILAGLLNKKLKSKSNDKQRHFYNRMSVNLFVMTLILLLTVFVGNTDEILQRELKTARYISKGEYEKALMVGLKAEETSPCLTALRSYSMSQLKTSKGNIKGSEMGNRLFIYPQIYGETFLYPQQVNGTIQSKSLESLIFYLADYKAPTDSSIYLNYQLSTLLLKREIDSFSSVIIEIEKENNLLNLYFPDSIPRYYMQALIYEEYFRGVPFSFLDNYYSGQTARSREYFNKYISERNSLHGQMEQYKKNLLSLRYRNTYWWFYDFQD
ncbi:MAG TPA: hypothetical protein VFC94_06820 [Bacteroidaceae bacterium]|nr:hypothetical protein [Bacteroidaceae bacterium]